MLPSDMCHETGTVRNVSRPAMDFTLSPEIENLRVRMRAFVEEHVLPLEADPENFSEHENIPDERLTPVREKARKAGLWAPQSPKEYGGMDLPIVAWAVMYEEAARSLFGPLAFNCMAPDDGNMNVLKILGTPAQKEKWLRPIVEGKVRSSFAMTEPAPGGGSDPSMIKTYAEKKGEQVEDLRPQVVHHRRRRRGAFHPGGAHLRRQAQGHHHVPLSTRTSPAGASCGASRSWGRRSTAAIASWNSTDSKCTTTTCSAASATG